MKFFCFFLLFREGGWAVWPSGQGFGLFLASERSPRRSRVHRGEPVGKGGEVGKFQMVKLESWPRAACQLRASK